MNLSTMFSDAKLGNNLGRTIMYAMTLIPIYMLQRPDLRLYLYGMMPLFPVCSATIVWSSIIDNHTLPSNIKILSIDDINLPIAWISLFMACPLNLLFYFYLDRVMPSGSYGVSRGLCYCFRRRSKPISQTNQDDHFQPFFGYADQSQSVDTIVMEKLGKRFGRNWVVKNLDLRIKEDEVFTLLGHNGAGKTSLMYMLTGMYPPSEGTAIIDGLDIRKDLPSIQKRIGFCQQFDVLFEKLTVKEHLEFVCLIKNFPSERK